MASLITPELQDFDSAADGRSAALKPQPQVQPIERPDDSAVTNNTVLDSKGNPSTELPDFLEAAEKMEGQRERGEEPEKPKKVDRRQREPKVEQKPEEKKEEVKPEEQTEIKQEQKPEPLPDDMLKVTPNDKPLTARRISQLLEKVEFRDKTLAEKEAIIKELQTKAATTQGSEELTKMKEELENTRKDLLRYRRRYDLDTDPEVKTKFEVPVVQAESTIKEVLNKYQLGEPTLKEIEKAGGFAEFSRSNKVYKIKESDANGDIVTVEKTAADLVKTWLNAMPVGDAEEIRSAMAQQSMTRAEKKRFFEKETAEAEKYFKSQEEQRTKFQQEQEANLEKTRKEYSDWAESQIKSKDWLKDKDLPAGATAEQKKQIEEHNEFAKQLRSMIKNPPTNSADKVKEILLGGVEAHHLRKENGAQAAKIKALEAELSKLKNGTRTTPKEGSILSGSRKSEEPRKTGKIDLDFGEAFEKAVTARERGEDSDSL